MRLFIAEQKRIHIQYVHLNFSDEFRGLLHRNGIPYKYYNDTHNKTNEFCTSFCIGGLGCGDTNVELNNADTRIFLDTVETHSATRVLYDYIGGGRFNVELRQ